MNLTQNDRLKQVTSDTLIADVNVESQTHFSGRLIGEDLNSSAECLSLATQAWDFLLPLDGQRNS